MPCRFHWSGSRLQIITCILCMNFHLSESPEKKSFYSEHTCACPACLPVALRACDVSNLLGSHCQAETSFSEDGIGPIRFFRICVCGLAFVHDMHRRRLHRSSEKNASIFSAQSDKRIILPRYHCARLRILSGIKCS